MSTIITKRQFPNYHKYEMELAGRPLTMEVGKLAELANAAVMVGYGDTRVLCCVTAAPRPRDGIDFFPLSVDFEEKLYSVGRIPGSFNRREGRPGEKGILTSRVIDRPIRPLFPSDFRNDVSVMCTVMSVDHDCTPEIAALIGTSAALAISDIPWNGPVGALKVGLVDGKLVFNPDSEQRKVSDLDVTVVSTHKKVVMIEAGANEVPNDVMFEAIRSAHEENQKVITPFSIPGGTSFLATGTWDTEYEGLNQLAASAEYGALDPETAPVNFVFQTYHLMVAMYGLIMLTVILALVFTLRGGKIQNMKWLQRLVLISPVFPLIAIQAGWFTAEVGRQPWVVYPSATSPEGVSLLTNEGVSQSVSAPELVITMVLFLVVYAFLMVAWARTMGRFIKEGPVAEHEPALEGAAAGKTPKGNAAPSFGDDLAKEGE